MTNEKDTHDEETSSKASEAEEQEERLEEQSESEDETSEETLEEESSEDSDQDSDSDDAEEASDEDDSDDDDSDDEDAEEASDEDEDETEAVAGGGGEGPVYTTDGPDDSKPVGMAAFFDLPDELMLAAAHTRDSDYDEFEAYSPFPIHGMDDAMGLGRSWIPWVTFGAGSAGLLTANALQFGTMTFDWPMIIGGKPFAPWPSFVPIMFELTVLFAGVTTAIVMLIAAGCFRKPFIIDEEITKDRFALWISAEDEHFDADEVQAFMESLGPVEIRTINEGA